MIDLLGMQRAVWRSARGTTEKIVLLAIADFYSDRSPEPWPSVPTLAERCSLGRTAVLEAIARWSVTACSLSDACRVVRIVTTFRT